MLILPKKRRIWTPSQQQQSAPHSALLMVTGTTPDPYFGNVVNLTTFDGANGSTTFPNLATSSPGPAFAVNAGSPALSNAYAELAGQTTSLACTAVNYKVDTGTDADYLMTTTSDMTFEFSMMVRTTGTLANAILWDVVHSGSGRIMAGYIPVGGITGSNFRSRMDIAGQGNFDPGGNTVSMDAWHRYAISRDGGNLRGFIDGTQVGSTIAVGSWGSNTGTTALTLGSRTPNAAAVVYFANFRYTLGVGRYTANYTPATTPFPTS